MLDRKLVREALDTIFKFQDFYHAEITLREYLLEILRELWIEQDSFSGKRPLGNSGWAADIGDQLVRKHFINGTLPEDEMDSADFDWKDLDEFMLACIGEL